MTMQVVIGLLAGSVAMLTDGLGHSHVPIHNSGQNMGSTQGVAVGIVMA